MADSDVIVIGTGLAGLVAACELVDRGKKVLMLDQENAPFLGGQAFWSLGGLFMVDTPEQRRMGIKDSPDLAFSDWMGSAQFDRTEDHWPREWAKAYLEFCASDMRSWLHGMGMRWFPVVGWAERGGAQAHGHGNSVPRFHLTWGTGPGVVEPFEAKVRAAMDTGNIEVRFRHRVTGLTMNSGSATGVRGEILSEDSKERGEATNREVIGDFELEAGIGIGCGTTPKAFKIMIRSGPNMEFASCRDHRRFGLTVRETALRRLFCRDLTHWARSKRYSLQGSIIPGSS